MFTDRDHACLHGQAKQITQNRGVTLKPADRSTKRLRQSAISFQLSIEAKENTLRIKGAKTAKEEQKGEVLYQGIAARAFERIFQLADHVQVKNAALENGLLHVDLVREIPEAKKPRQIPIGNSQAKAQVIDTKAAA